MALSELTKGIVLYNSHGNQINFLLESRKSKIDVVKCHLFSTPKYTQINLSRHWKPLNETLYYYFTFTYFVVAAAFDLS